MSSVIFAAKFRLMVKRTSRVLFVGHVLALAQMRKKENCHRVIIHDNDALNAGGIYF